MGNALIAVLYGQPAEQGDAPPSFDASCWGGIHLSPDQSYAFSRRVACAQLIR
jgi:hypothetical protein